MALTCPNCRFLQQSTLYICPECGVIRCNSTNCLRQYNNIVINPGELCHFCGKGRWECIIQTDNSTQDTPPCGSLQNE